MAAMIQISPLARFHERFFRVVSWSWRELLCVHMFDASAGVIHDEYNQELHWSSTRKLSMIHAFSDHDDEGNASPALEALIKHYGIERVSAAKDRHCFIIDETGQNEPIYLHSTSQRCVK